MSDTSYTVTAERVFAIGAIQNCLLSYCNDTDFRSLLNAFNESIDPYVLRKAARRKVDTLLNAINEFANLIVQDEDWKICVEIFFGDKYLEFLYGLCDDPWKETQQKNIVVMYVLLSTADFSTRRQERVQKLTQDLERINCQTEELFNSFQFTRYLLVFKVFEEGRYYPHFYTQNLNQGRNVQVTKLFGKKVNENNDWDVCLYVKMEQPFRPQRVYINKSIILVPPEEGLNTYIPKTDLKAFVAGTIKNTCLGSLLTSHRYHERFTVQKSVGTKTRFNPPTVLYVRREEKEEGSGTCNYFMCYCHSVTRTTEVDGIFFVLKDIDNKQYDRHILQSNKFSDICKAYRSIEVINR